MEAKAIVKRLTKYRASLVNFKELGFKTIYSTNLGESVGESPEQVRKDFSRFSLKGNKKAGYEIDPLLKSINYVLGKNIIQKIIVVGMGNIGKAFIQYKWFSSQNVSIIAAFDIDPSKHNKKMGLHVHPLSQLKDIIHGHNIQIAVIATPDSAAQEICDRLVAYGVRAILNFAPVVLKVPDEIIVHNLDLVNEINSMIYYVNNHKLYSL
jgi:redox-sensing transcriptional repressor